jgi:hypothetical protein
MAESVFSKGPLLLKESADELKKINEGKKKDRFCKPVFSKSRTKKIKVIYFQQHAFQHTF